MLNHLIKSVSQNPGSPLPHEILAGEYLRLGRVVPALAEYRSSTALGGGCGPVCALLSETFLQNLRAYSHNTWLRLNTIAEHLKGLYGGDDFSVLDIGGGHGDLCLFLPNAAYVLAEPAVNGISGLELSFPDKSFDFVTACHVLEHIPIRQRDSFLDQLCRKARSHVVLLNPFREEDSGSIEKLAWELTGEEWAKEHLECELPELEDIRRYAAERGLKYRILPNGSRIVAAATVFLDYFAKAANRTMEWVRVNRLLNSFAAEDIQNCGKPNAWLVELEVST